MVTPAVPRTYAWWYSRNLLEFCGLILAQTHAKQVLSLSTVLFSLAKNLFMYLFYSSSSSANGLYIIFPFFQLKNLLNFSKILNIQVYKILCTNFIWHITLYIKSIYFYIFKTHAFEYYVYIAHILTPSDKFQIFYTLCWGIYRRDT